MNEVLSRSASLTSAEIHRSRIWYSDGSIILQAESVQFRVHASLLSQRSNVLKIMFLKENSSMESNPEACPMVYLSDRAQDVEYLLRAIYDPVLVRPSNNKLLFPEVAAWLRLGRKYDLKDIYHYGLRILTSEFPNTLEKWDRRVPQMKSHPSNFIDCINICRELTIISPVPLAFYSWLHYLHETGDLESIFFGIPRLDGTVAILSPDDQRLSVTAFDKLLCTQWSAFVWLNKEPVGCTTPQKCIRFRMKIKDQLAMPTPKLSGLTRAPPPNAFTKGMCGRCSEVANDSYERGRAVIWRRIPNNLGLPPWEDLKNSRF